VTQYSPTPTVIGGNEAPAGFRRGLTSPFTQTTLVFAVNRRHVEQLTGAFQEGLAGIVLTG